MNRAIRLAALAWIFTSFTSFISGCALTSDLIYLAVGPGNSPTLHGTALPVGPGETSREIRLDRDHGLVCSFKDSPHVRDSSVEMETVFPNGIAPMMWLATGLEGLAFAPAVAVGDKAFRSPWFLVPVGLDLTWGLYRSFTIKPEIRRLTLVKSGAGGTRTVTLKTPCPLGTAVVLASGGEDLSVHVAADGWIDPIDLPPLIAFLERHPAEIRLESGARLDLGPAAALLAVARAAASEREARQREEGASRSQGKDQAGVVILPPPIPARAIVRWSPFGPPQVFGVVIDFPLASVCQSDAGCLPGQHCADRGDGVPLCFGPSARHSFCAGPTDCAGGACVRRPDGVGVCVR